MKSFLMFFLTIFLGQAISAKCMVKNDKDLVNRSELIFIGKITSANIETNKSGLDKLCRESGKRALDLHYEVMLDSSLKGHLLTNGPFRLNYKYACMRKPSSVSFEKGKEYLFAVQKLKDGNINLVGYSCGFWGWEKKDAAKIFAIINKN